VKLWDHVEINQQMFFFNTITRLMGYEHRVVSGGLDHCYDCAAEVIVLTKYLHRWCVSQSLYDRALCVMCCCDVP